MNTINSVDAFYPSFPLSGEPVAIPCVISIVEANGKRYVKTPFAMIDAFATDDAERLVNDRNFYRSAESCGEYLATEYRWSQQAEPIREALLRAIHNSGEMVGAARVAEKCDVSTFDVYRIARGHHSFGLKRIRAAVKALRERTPA